MRILHIDYGLGFGGSIVSLSELVRGLKEVGGVTSTVVVNQAIAGVAHLLPGVPVSCVTPRLTYRHRGQLSQRLATAPARSLLTPLAMKGYALLDVLHDRWLSRQIELAAGGRQFDLVHANNGWSPSALHVAKRLGVRCITHFRGFEQPSARPNPTLHAYRDTVAACVGISPAVSESLVASGIPSALVHTIANPVTVEQYVVPEERTHELRREHGLVANDFVLGLFGRVIPWKGQLEFLQGVEPLLAEWPALKVMIVGDEADFDGNSYGMAVRALSAQPAYAGRVIFAGYQSQVAEYYALSDAVVHCSVLPEPFGRVVIEGMAAGRPVIAMNEGGPRSIVTHEVDGLLVAPRDAGAMNDALRRLRADAAWGVALGSRARETARTVYGPVASARAFLSLAR